jgi:hypothetical protein
MKSDGGSDAQKGDIDLAMDWIDASILSGFLYDCGDN